MTPTPKQLATFSLVIRTSRQRPLPTMVELADQLGVSKVTIFEHVELLECKEPSSSSNRLVKVFNVARRRPVRLFLTIVGTIAGRTRPGDENRLKSWWTLIDLRRAQARRPANCPRWREQTCC